ncbi:MAG: ABC transporter substrate-binding protein, partial [Caulobacteraceae bacterium]|nr:ABC transporter substrate-binding protein [Caulobacteraceae bacterium]
MSNRSTPSDLTRRGAAAGLAAAMVQGGGLARAAPGPEPRRIVSLNPCLDAILVQVADRGQVAALSHYSHYPDSSSLPDLGAGYAFTYESAEEVVALRPDLVLAARHTAAATRAALRTLGASTELFGVPSTIDESLEQVTRIAALVRRPARGEALAGRIRAA